ncbi:hypothetical protein SEPCBS57363_002938 [Sporothrix epigloea]|uniref:Nup53p-like protein n=1 Tax=Sporothrix epigloea TaxID=1892477 RepID=A0ABP0DM96_9PEZI
MAPLVLHNVPDDELYVGADGVTRPFAVVGAADERRSARLRRQATTTHGSFGRARSRPRTGSVGPGRAKPQPAKSAATPFSMAADEMFGNWKREQDELSQQNHTARNGGADSQMDDLMDVRGRKDSSISTVTGRKVSGGKLLPNGRGGDDDITSSQKQKDALSYQKAPNQPTEIILRGYRSADYQYAAIHHYEQIAGRICEDYPRDPPVSSRRYRSSLRDGAVRSAATFESNGRAALTSAERQAVMRAASGQHWVKVTFESTQAADAALYASPQNVMGYLVTAELYRGVPLSANEDVAIQDVDAMDDYGRAANGGGSGGNDQGFGRYSAASSFTVDSGTVTQDDPFSTRSSTAGSSVAAGGPTQRQGWTFRRGNKSPTLDTDDTIGSPSTPTPAPKQQAPPRAENDEFCRRIPTARRATLKAPELALLPSESTARRFVKQLPLLHRLTGTIIGNQVPRRENGLFDWEKASLYWKLIWWLDYLFQLFAGEILDANKDE